MPLAPSAGQQTEHVLRLESVPGGEMRYLLYLPVDYAESDRPFPLILFLHGSGERGRNFELVKREGLPRDLEHWLHFPFVVVSPQIAKGERWSASVLSDLLEEIQRANRIDSDRVSLTGLSSGAVAALETGGLLPRPFRRRRGGHAAASARRKPLRNWKNARARLPQSLG